jgi:hypothetical protein
MVAVLMPHPGRSAFNNSWHCMDVLTEELRRALYADYGVAEVVEVEISAAQTLPAHELERLAGTCDAWWSGSGHAGRARGGSCTTP